MKGVSAILITRDEEKNVGDCLASLAFADEIVVVDSGSTDRTEEVCRRDPRVRWFPEEWKGFGPQKNSALAKALGPWIFSIDADERVSDELAREIAGLDLSSVPVDGYRVPRRSYFGDAWVRHGGWYPDYTIRLWRKDRGRFNDRQVHEVVRLSGRVGTLAGDLIHYTYRDTADFLERMDRYAALGAEELRKKGARGTLLDLWFRPPFTFLKMYLLRRGFLDGALGFRLAMLYSRYTFAKYSKLREKDAG
ncbi:MAG TPA: glycosyltransferase family 2 protein [Candidatus Deferrimicrobiaceae bacterium]|nr:glycosyltransferase family 2 protein [Candidatus Deferrimicrobiaceae bacterium]